MTKVYGTTAGHVSSLKSLAMLCACLQSVLNQTKPVDLFCLSWSADKQLLNQTREVIRLFKRHFERCDLPIIVMEQPSRLQQFQHYKCINDRLLKLIDLDPNTLIIFGDSDDVWDKIRVQFMYDVASRSSKDVVVFNWNYGVFPGEHKFERLRRTEHLEDFEYWAASARLKVFSRFFSSMPHPAYLTSPYCDLAFATFLSKEDHEQAKCPDNTRFGLYWYDGPHYAAGGCTTQEEITLKFLEGQLAECYPGPLVNVLRYDSYSGTMGKPVVIKPITMATLVGLKNGSIAMKEHIRHQRVDSADYLKAFTSSMRNANY